MYVYSQLKLHKKNKLHYSTCSFRQATGHRKVVIILTTNLKAKSVPDLEIRMLYSTLE